MSSRDRSSLCVAIYGKSDITDKFVEEILLPERVMVSSFDSIEAVFEEFSLITFDALVLVVKDVEELEKIDRYVLANPSEYIPLILLADDEVYKNKKAGYDAGICFPLSSDFSDLKSWIMSLMTFKKRMDSAKERESRRISEENSYKIRQVYRDVIWAVTQNKLKLLLDISELPFYKEEDKVLELKIDSSNELVLSKKKIEEYFENMGWSRSRIFDVVVSVSEAVSNVLKHAKSGVITVFALKDRFHIWISDNGKGIDFSNIPKSTLQKGHSTGNSLGMGFCIMLELVDKLFLFTHSSGTILIMEIYREKQISQMTKKRKFSVEDRV